MRREPRSLAAAVVFCLAGMLCLAFVLSGCASSHAGKALNVGVIGSGLADYVSTRSAINSGRGREANPLMGQGAIRQALVKTAGIGGVMAGASLLDQKGHRTLGLVVRIASMAVWGMAAAHNWRLR